MLNFNHKSYSENWHHNADGNVFSMLLNDTKLLRLYSNGWPVTEYVALKEWCWQGKTKVQGQKSDPVPLCVQQISHGLTWDQSWASMVRCQQLPSWAMAQSLMMEAQCSNTNNKMLTLTILTLLFATLLPLVSSLRQWSKPKHMHKFLRHAHDDILSQRQTWWTQA